MPTKQEIIDMMENHLPGELVSIAGHTTAQPPAYPSLDGALHDDHRPSNQPVEYDDRVYTISTGPTPINHPPAQFGSRSHLTFCPHCRSQQMTRVDHQANMMTHIIAAILCCTTCSCCLPYLFDNCKSVRHYCPQCDSYLGAQMK